MRIGITLGVGSLASRSLARLGQRAVQIEEQGFAGLWLPMAFGFDAITALVAIGRDTARVEVGTAVVPTFPRHPVVMAQQALTAQEALGGRFTLGIGLSHRVMMEDALGLPYQRPARHMREYLSVLAPLLRGEAVSYRGEQYRVETALTVSAPPVPLLVAAMGPEMLRLAGELADGTVTSWVGPRTLAEHIVPTITAAARAAGKPAPRIVAGLPVGLTSDPDAARQTLAPGVAMYNTLPAYQAMFAREGVTAPEDLALFGDAAALDAQFDRLAAAGVTDFLAQVLAPDAESASRTLEYLAARQAAGA